MAFLKQINTAVVVPYMQLLLFTLHQNISHNIILMRCKTNEILISLCDINKSKSTKKCNIEFKLEKKQMSSR